MKYFIADIHFCHRNVIKFSQRPFNNVEEMDHSLIERWNKVVRPKDDVFILGDFIVRGSGKEAYEILKKLN